MMQISGISASVNYNNSLQYQCTALQGGRHEMYKTPQNNIQ